jgi:flagellar hook-associated protein 1 FlgK
MSLQGAMSTALSSLAAEQRASAVIANNIANAHTPGYVRRELPRGENLVGGGGQGVATGVTQRAADTVLAAASRTAGGASAYASRMQELLGSFTSVVGQPADERSLSSRLGAFKEAMTVLSVTPENAVAQSQALATAQDLVDNLHAVDSAISTTRTEADLGVSRDVDAVNTALQNLKEVDRQLAQAAARGGSTAEYEDKRDGILAGIAAKLPIRIYDNGPGRLIVTTDGGNTLYDSGSVHKLAFTHTPSIASDVRFGGQPPFTGGLSGVTIDGLPLRVSDSGSISANLAIRDETMPNFADMLDQVAGRLAESFQDGDPTVSGTQAGLFTRDGAATFDPAQPFLGMARSIALHVAVDPDRGGAIWRMRDGVGAGTEGKASSNKVVLGWLDAMEQNRGYEPGTGLPARMGLSQAAAQTVGLMQGERATWADRAATRASIATQASEDLVNKTAVSVDEELQRMMMVQQTYSASVQVIQAVAKMLEELSALRA